METVTNGFFSVILTIIGILGVLAAIGVFVIKKCYLKVEQQGKIYVVSGSSNKRRFIRGAGFYIPFLSNAEILDATKKMLVISKPDRNDVNKNEFGLPCKDNVRVNMTVSFYLEVPKDNESLDAIINNLTIQRINDQQALTEWFTPKLSEALKTVCKRFDYYDLYNARDEFRDQVRGIVGSFFDGFELSDVNIESIVQTPLSDYREDDLMDSQGRLKITQIIEANNTKTLKEKEEKATERKQVETDAQNLRFALDRQLAEGEAKKQKDIRIIKSREDAEAVKKETEFSLESEKAKEEKRKEIEITILNNNRELELSTINNSKMSETATVEKDKAVQEQIIKKDSLLSVAEIDKEKIIESQRKDLSELTSQRVKIERSIAVEEEETLTLRATEEANRYKKVAMIQAETRVESENIEKIKKAEAAKTVAITVAETIEKESILKLKASENEAQSKIVIAEARIQEESAKGLAEVKVETQKAESVKQMGLAEAASMEAKGEAKAKSIKLEMDAIQHVDEKTRAFDLKKYEIDAQKEINIKRIESEQEISKQSANIMSSALGKANIQLIGGAGELQNMIIPNVLSSKAKAASINTFVDETGVMESYKNGERNLPEDVKDILLNTDLTNMSVGQLIATYPEIRNILANTVTSLIPTQK